MGAVPGSPLIRSRRPWQGLGNAWLNPQAAHVV